MTQTTPSLNLRQMATDALGGVFDTMLSRKLVPNAPAGTPLPLVRRVTGSVGFGGEKVTGAVYIHLPGALATQVTAGMLGLAPEEIEGDEMVNDVVGELCNMVAGGLKSALCDAGLTCAVSTPAIIRGDAFQIETMPDIRQEHLWFDCPPHHLLLELHVKFQ